MHINIVPFDMFFFFLVQEYRVSSFWNSLIWKNSTEPSKKLTRFSEGELKSTLEGSCKL